LKICSFAAGSDRESMLSSIAENKEQINSRAGTKVCSGKNRATRRQDCVHYSPHQPFTNIAMFMNYCK